MTRANACLEIYFILCIPFICHPPPYPAILGSLQCKTTGALKTSSIQIKTLKINKRLKGQIGEQGGSGIF